MAPESIHEISRALGSIEGKVDGIEGKIGDLRDNIQSHYSENRLNNVRASESRQRLHERIDALDKTWGTRLRNAEQTIAELQNDLKEVMPIVKELNQIRQRAEGAGWAAGWFAGWAWAALVGVGVILGWAATHLLPLFWKGP